MKRRTLFLVAVVIGAVVVLVPLAAMGAVSLFDDVSDDDIFVADTNWMQVTGVSKGCNPPLNTEYCPKDFVRRDQMAAFLHRLAESQVVDAGSVQGMTADQLRGGYYVKEATFTSPEGPPEPPKPYSIVSETIELLGELVSCDPGDVAVDAMGVRTESFIDKDTGEYSNSGSYVSKGFVFFPTSGTSPPTGYGFIRPRTLEHWYGKVFPHDVPEDDPDFFVFYNGERVEELTIRVTCANMTP